MGKLMAVDNEARRLAAFNFCDASDSYALPLANSVVPKADRGHMLGMYPILITSFAIEHRVWILHASEPDI